MLCQELARLRRGHASRKRFNACRRVSALQRAQSADAKNSSHEGLHRLLDRESSTALIRRKAKGDPERINYLADRNRSGNRQRGCSSLAPRKFSTAFMSSTNSAARLSCSCSM